MYKFLTTHLNVSVSSRSNWNQFEKLVFEERGKAKNPEKKLKEHAQGREPTTNLTPPHTAPIDAVIWTQATLVGGRCSQPYAIQARHFLKERKVTHLAVIVDGPDSFNIS